MAWLDGFITGVTAAGSVLVLVRLGRRQREVQAWERREAAHAALVRVHREVTR